MVRELSPVRPVSRLRKTVTNYAVEACIYVFNAECDPSRLS